MLIDISLLYRNRNYALLYTGQAVSFAGTMMTGVALPWQIYQITHSVIMIGLLSLFQLLPLLFTALLGGVMADKYPRRQLLFVTESVLIFACFLLMWNAGRFSPSLAVIFLSAILMSSLSGLHRPALESLTQQILKPADFAAAGALSGFKFNFAMILGPAVAGLLIAHTGLVWTYFVDLLSFLISLMTLFFMRQIPVLDKPLEKSITVWRALKEGLHFAITREDLAGSYLVDFIAMVFGIPNALFPVIAQWLGGAKVLGLLYSAPAAGALLASLFSGWTVKIRRYGLAIAISAGAWGVAIIFFGVFVHHLFLALFFLAVSGALDQFSGIFRITLWNTSIPNTLRGRLAGIEMISYMSGPKLGDTESSLVASAFGVIFSIISGGVLCVAGVIVCSLLLPGLIKYPEQKTRKSSLKS